MSAIAVGRANPGRALTFTIPGRIGGKGRHRSVIRAGRIATYTPQKTESDEALVRHFANAALVERHAPQLMGALGMHVSIYRHYPKSWTAKQKAAAKGWVTGKPDLDNTAKLICDACNSVAYQDDSQIAALTITRRYAQGFEPECVVVEFKELEAT